jgi:hypothetical protein
VSVSEYCFTCGLDHPTYPTYEYPNGCPHAGRTSPLPQAAAPPASIELSVEDQLKVARQEARVQRQKAAEARERAWSKTKTIVRLVVEEQRQLDQLALKYDMRTIHADREVQAAAERVFNHTLRDGERAAAPAQVKAGTRPAFAPNVAAQVKDDAPLTPDPYPKKMEVVWTKRPS